MARIRTLKPEFFKDERLVEFSPMHRLFFAGLWLLADREGRLEDRPKFIKAELFPYEEFDADAALQEFHVHGFLIRYEINGKRYIQVKNFLKHQRPNSREAESEIPAPASMRMHAQDREEGKGKEGKGTGRGREDAPPIRASSILEFFEKTYIAKVRKPIVFAFDDTQKAYELVRTYGADEVKAAISRYFAEGDAFVQKKGFPFWLFYKQVAEFVAGKGEETAEASDAALLKRVEAELEREGHVR